LPPVPEWNVTPSLDTIHREQEEVLCEDCHEVLPPVKPPSDDMCIACHGESPDGLFELTAYLEPNPHDGHEGGLPCYSCHPNFGEYKSPCESCHADEEMVPVEEVGN
jgi:hypothetical protein